MGHVRFDERGVETGRWSGYLGTGGRKARQRTSLPPVVTALHLDDFTVWLGRPKNSPRWAPDGSQAADLIGMTGDIQTPGT